MVQNPFKAGWKISLTSGDVSLKGVVGRRSKKDDLQKIKIPSEWRGTIESLEIGSECILTYIKDEKEVQYKMVLMEKHLDTIDSELLLKLYKEIGERSNLRTHERIKVFIFAMISEKDNIEAEIREEDLLNGTVSDISLGGCLLMTDCSFDIDSYLGLIFESWDNRGTIKIRCQIKTRRKSHIDKCYYYGLQFIGLGDAVQEALRSFVAENKSAK